MSSQLFAADPPTPASPDSPPAITTSSTAAPDAAAQDDDDAAFQPAEPDFRLINLPTTMRLPLFKGNFLITHRFAGNLRGGSFGDTAQDFFGIDEGAFVGLEYRFAVAKHLQAVFYRTGLFRTIDLTAKYDALHQGSLPFSASVVFSTEGTNNFREHYAPALGASVSRMFGDVAAAYVVPMWVHNSAAATGDTRDTGYVGVGARVRIRPTVYLVAEGTPRVGGYAPGTTAYGFGIEKRAGGHMFQLNFSNGPTTTPAMLARGGQPGYLSLGFNLARKFF